jgi:hypothetical protein
MVHLWKTHIEVTPKPSFPEMTVVGRIGLRRMVCSEEEVSMLAKWTGTPGVRVDPSSLTQECLTAIGSKKIDADVSVAMISCDARAKRIILRGFAFSWGRCVLGENEGMWGILPLCQRSLR